MRRFEQLVHVLLSAIVIVVFAVMYVFALRNFHRAP